jgi:hypothetical protein
VVASITDTLRHSRYVRVKWDNEYFEQNYPEFAEDSILGNATKVIEPALGDITADNYEID